MGVITACAGHLGRAAGEESQSDAGTGPDLCCPSVEQPWRRSRSEVTPSFSKISSLSAHFDGKQSRDPVDLPSTSNPSPRLTTFAFRSREVKRLLLDLDSYGGTDP